MCENSHENASKIKKRGLGTSLVGPVVKTLLSNAGGMGSIPRQGTKFPYVMVLFLEVGKEKAVDTPAQYR